MVIPFRSLAKSLALCVLAGSLAQAQPVLTQAHQDFTTDPGWDNYQNRIVGTEMPRVVQDFGWSPTSHSAPESGPGEIGGQVSNSRYAAYYAMPLGHPFTFNDPLSVSGRVALADIGLRGVAYFGFFNSARHTWRVYSSLAFRIWEEDMLGQVMVDWMSSDWQAGGAETAVLLPPDGSSHTFSFSYDPEARPDPVWRDALLEKHITSETGNGRPYELQGEEFILERAKQDEPSLTAEELHERLIAARKQGLVEYFHRHNQHRWWKRPNPEQSHGCLTLQFDDDTPYIVWFTDDMRNAPVAFDRFGLFNICRYGTNAKVYFSDLTLNGQKIDLSSDPHWLGANNHAQWTEPDYQAMNNFGWAETNWAGTKPGEVGGLFWRIEPDDSMYGYYADETGPLTLDDPIEVEGDVCFVDGMSDASMYIGYFNRETFLRPYKEGGGDGIFPKASMMGISLNDASRVGYYFAPFVCAADNETARDDNRYTFTPDRKPCHFTFRYDPKANGGVGRATYSIDGKEGAFDLTPEQRKAGAQFDHFGLASVRSGGNSVELYFDDLSYTVRRGPAAPPAFHKQTYVEVPYPHESAGRRH